MHDEPSAFQPVSKSALQHFSKNKKTDWLSSAGFGRVDPTEIRCETGAET